jgi:glycosyltransferase involved in cell wall biosynthesis
VLLFFGFVREYKGLRYLLEALPDVLKTVNVTLLVVGEFWKDKAVYLNLIRELNVEEHVIVIDDYVPNEEVGLYFSAADLVIQPYVSATGSGIVQIAFGFEKPVIATRVGSLPEVVRDGSTGYLVSPAESTELAEAIIRFFQENRAAEFVANIQQEHYKFSWERLVNMLEACAATHRISSNV